MYATLEQQFDEQGIAGWAVVFYDQDDERIMAHICWDELTARCLLTDPAAQEERARMFAEARQKAAQRKGRPGLASVAWITEQAPMAARKASR